MILDTHTKLRLPSPDQCLPGRATPIPVADKHLVLGTPMTHVPKNMEQIVFGMGCFWGAERLFWQLAGVYSTAVGYAGGVTPNPTYQEVCSGSTAHTEVVLVVYDPKQIDLNTLLIAFWEQHDPTQGMRQGNDLGTQYRSAIYYTDERQREAVLSSQAAFQQALQAAGKPVITTEIKALEQFYFAEDYHQQYLAKNPNGYCGLAGTGVQCAL